MMVRNAIVNATQVREVNNMTDLTQEQREKIAEEARDSCKSCDTPCSYCNGPIHKAIDLTLAVRDSADEGIHKKYGLYGDVAYAAGLAKGAVAEKEAVLALVDAKIAEWHDRWEREWEQAAIILRAEVEKVR